MIDAMTSALGRTVSAPCVSAICGDHPLPTAASSPNLLEGLAAIVGTPREAPPVVVPAPSPVEPVKGPGTDWRLDLLRKVWSRLWVKGRRRWVVLTLILTLVIGGLAVAIGRLQSQGCDCAKIEREMDHMKTLILDQRRLLGIHQRYWEETKREPGASRFARSIVPSVQVMMELLAKGYTRTEVLNYFHDRRAPTAQEGPDNLPKPNLDTPDISVPAAEAETLEETLNEQISALNATAEAEEQSEDPVYRVGVVAAHMSMCVVTAGLSVVAVIIALTKLSFCHRSATQGPTAPEDGIPMADLGGGIEAIRERNPSDLEGLPMPGRWYDVNLQAGPDVGPPLHV